MKFLIPYLILPVLFLLSCAGRAPQTAGGSGDLPPAAGIPAHYQDIPFPPLKYEPPYPGDFRFQLDEKTSIYFVPDTSLPLINLQIFLVSENLPSSPENTALLSLYDALLLNGGTEALTPQQVEDSLEFISAQVGISLDHHVSRVSIDVLKKDLFPTLGLVREAILRPRFDQEIFNLQKKKMVEAAKHRFDKPFEVVGRAFELVMQGHHPANWLYSESSIGQAKMNALQKMKGNGFVFRRAVIAVSGDFNRQAVTDSLRAFLSAFPPSDSTLPETAWPGARAPGVYFIDKDFEQATVQVGFPGIRRPHPDYYALSVASYIFGAGGFTSRLVGRVRTEAGLAYSIRSFVESDYYRQGAVGFSLQTKAESTAQALALSFEELQRMSDSGITSEELDRARNGLILSLPSMFDTPAATAGIFAQSEIWGRELEHFRKYPAKLAELTVDDVNAAFRKYFRSDSARVIIAGPRSFVLDSVSAHRLGKLGAMTELPLESLAENQ